MPVFFKRIKLFWLRSDSGLMCILLISNSKHSNESNFNPNAYFRHKRTWFVLHVTIPNWETYQLNMNSSLVRTVQSYDFFVHSLILPSTLSLARTNVTTEKYSPPQNAKNRGCNCNMNLKSHWIIRSLQDSCF